MATSAQPTEIPRSVSSWLVDGALSKASTSRQLKLPDCLNEQLLIN